MNSPAWDKLDILEIASALCSHLETKGIDAVLVGGACVSIYSNNAYESFDLDFVSNEPWKRIESALAEIGFKKTEGRHFDHPDSNYYAEFVPPPVSIGQEIVTKLGTLKTKYGTLSLLTPTDCVKDRLAAYIHWKDHQAFEQGLLVALRHSVHLKAIEAWAAQEKGTKAFGEFKSELDLRKKRSSR